MTLLLFAVIQVEWQLYVKCNSPDTWYPSDTAYSGSYFIRITGECKK
jgi:hypothetical protein